MIDIVLNVLLGLGLLGSGGLLLFFIGWIVKTLMGRKSRKEAEKAQALKATGGGGGPAEPA